MTTEVFLTRDNPPSLIASGGQITTLLNRGGVFEGEGERKRPPKQVAFNRFIIFQLNDTVAIIQSRQSQSFRPVRPYHRADWRRQSSSWAVRTCNTQSLRAPRGSAGSYRRVPGE
jgi:hypothetical protein